MPVVEDSMRVERPVAPLRAQVVKKLRTAIVEGRFKPGQRLIERELCELTGVSRTSVREALRQLESVGLVEVVAYRGPVVARVSPRDAREIYQVRAVLEGLAGRLCALNASDEELSELRAAVEELEGAVRKGEVGELLPLKDHFYRALLRGAGNDLVERTLGGLNARVTFLRTMSLSQAHRPPETIKELHAIVRAIVARDPEEAEQACRRHVENAAEVAVAALEKSQFDEDR